MDQNITIEEFIGIITKELMAHKNGLKAIQNTPIELHINSEELTKENALKMAKEILSEADKNWKPEQVKNPDLMGAEEESETSLDKVVEGIFQRSYQPKRLQKAPQKTAIEEFQSIHGEMMIVIMAAHRRLNEELRKDVHSFSDISALIDLRSKLLAEVTKLCWLIEWMEEYDKAAFESMKKQADEVFELCESVMDRMDQADLF